jgi:hypothetical protein
MGLYIGTDTPVKVDAPDNPPTPNGNGAIFIFATM